MMDSYLTILMKQQRGLNKVLRIKIIYKYMNFNGFNLKEDKLTIIIWKFKRKQINLKQNFNKFKISKQLN